MHPETDLNRTALTQGGVVSRRQALAAGMTDRQINYRIDKQRWKRVAKGGYRTIQMDGRQNLVRAATSVLPDCVASHYSAAALHSLRHVDTQSVSVTVHSRTTHVFQGVRVFRSHDLDPNHKVRIDDIPTTSTARTIVDLAAVVHPTQLGLIIGDAVASQRTSAPAIQEVLEHVARRGKPGVTALREELAKWLEPTVEESPLEIAGNRILRQSAITGWVTEFAIPWSRSQRFDVAFPESHLAIEWDSRRWHMQGQALEKDRSRDAEALAHGWRILRFTWVDVHQRPGYVIQTVRDVLALT